MNQKLLTKVFIWGFLFLYLLVACISFCHAIQFFNIGNVQWMSITLAFAFELGLALSLAAILLSDENKKQTLPWILMVVLCLVQVVGNVYSTFKYISLSETEYYQYLAKPLLFFIQEVSQDTVQIIISWIIGAILPIIALFMTDMVASNIKNLSKSKESKVESEEILPIENAKEETNKVSQEDETVIHPPKQMETKKDSIKEIVPPKKNEESQKQETKSSPQKPKTGEQQSQENQNHKIEKGYFEYPYKEKEEK